MRGPYEFRQKFSLPLAYPRFRTAGALEAGSETALDGRMRKAVRILKKKGADSMQSKANLQDIFLLRARRDKLPVTMFLMNGFQMRGVITGFDAFVVILDSDGRQQVIYKHAISTIAPARPVDLAEQES